MTWRLLEVVDLLRGIFFVLFPSSFLGAKKEREKKGESSWSQVLSYLLNSASTQL